MNLILPGVQRRFRPVLLYWCGSAKEVPNGTRITKRPLPGQPQLPSLWFKCPECGLEHMAGMVLVEITNDKLDSGSGDLSGGHGGGLAAGEEGGIGCVASKQGSEPVSDSGGEGEV